MSTPELLRETLKEVLYGPSISFGLSTGLFSDAESGLLRAAHGFTHAQAVTPAAPGRPSPAQMVRHVRQQLAFTAAQLQDPHALLPDEDDAWTAPPPSSAAWREELVALAGAGQALYEALYLPLNAEQLRVAHGGILHAAYHTGALRFHLRNISS